MFLTQLLPVELWMIIFNIEHKMIFKEVLNEINELSNQVKELNKNIFKKSELWCILKWNNFKIEFNKKDFFGRCQTESFKYFTAPKNHKCALCCDN